MFIYPGRNIWEANLVFYMKYTFSYIMPTAEDAQMGSMSVDSSMY